MSRKGQKGPSANKQKENEQETEDALQAVVLADSFETKFHPFTVERPRCLLPLANTPLIEYTFEFLAHAGVEHVFLYCGAHTDQVEEYIKASKWCLPASPFDRLEVIRSTSQSVGDVMRDLDSRDLITGDFLVVTGDVVSNFPLEPALAKHRARRAVDKNSIMTMVLREAGPVHRTKSKGTYPVFFIDPNQDRCVHYEEIGPRPESHYFNVDPDIFKAHPELDIREDLIDCYIDICTPDVLALWTDSFDYERPRKHFLHGVLKDYELHGKKIHTHIVDDYYAARVRNLPAYDAVSKDIISRWAYPLCPDSNLLEDQSYRLQRGNIYMEDGVVLARSCVVKRKTVLGYGTSIGDGSVISNSIIGRRCQIGKNVTIDGSYIWDDAVIGDDAEVRQAVIANEAVVGKKCKLEPGALVSFGVVIAEGTKVPGTRRLTRAKDPQKKDPVVVGNGGEGYDYEEEETDDDDEERVITSGLVYNLPELAVSDSSISTIETELSDEPIIERRTPRESFTSESNISVEEEFYVDAAASVLDSLQRGDAWDVIQLELMSQRLSANASDHGVRRAVAVAFIRRISQLVDSGAVGIGEAVKQVFSKYRELAARTMFDKEQSEKPDQVDFLLLIQRELAHRNKGESILLFTAKELYDIELLEEEAFTQWWEDARSVADTEMERVRSQTAQFVEWLANAAEESDEEDEDESEEEE